MTDSPDEAAVAAAHRAALAALRRAVEILGPTPEPARLPAAVDQAVAELAGEGDRELTRDLTRLYLYGARVGAGAAQDPRLAERWLKGWSAARARTPEQARAALVDGIRFADRVHRTIGLEE